MKHTIKIELGQKSYHGHANTVKKSDKRQAKWKKQRVKNGFDDTETWNLDTTLARFILPRLKRFREVNIGHPAYMTWESWCTLIDRMIEGFEIQLNEGSLLDKNLSAEEEKKNRKKVRMAWLLLGRYGRDLWW